MLIAIMQAIYSKLELLMQFPASNDDKYYSFWKLNMCNIDLFNWLSMY